VGSPPGGPTRAPVAGERVRLGVTPRGDRGEVRGDARGWARVQSALFFLYAGDASGAQGEALVTLRGYLFAFLTV
jgi:hypothetical protein